MNTELLTSGRKYMPNWLDLANIYALCPHFMYLYVSCVTVVHLHEDLRLHQCDAGQVMQQEVICKVNQLVLRR